MALRDREQRNCQDAAVDSHRRSALVNQDRGARKSGDGEHATLMRLCTIWQVKRPLPSYAVEAVSFMHDLRVPVFLPRWTSSCLYCSFDVDL